MSTQRQPKDRYRAWQRCVKCVTTDAVFDTYDARVVRNDSGEIVTYPDGHASFRAAMDMSDAFRDSIQRDEWSKRIEENIQ